MSFYVPGPDGIPERYKPGLGYNAENDTLYRARHISLSCDQRVKDLIDLAREFQNDQQIDYIGFDFIRTGRVDGYELAQLVIDDEIVAMVKRLMRGVLVDKEHLAADLIIETGPDGNFLDSDHTLQYFRAEFFDPQISNRMKYERWQEAGSLSVHRRAHERAAQILKQHHPEKEMDEKLAREIYTIVERETDDH